MTLRVCLLLASALFSIGVYGLLTRRHVIAMLLSVELMANAANIVLISFAAHRAAGVDGQIFALFAMALTVAEVVIGLAIVMLLQRARGAADVDAAKELEG